MSNILTDNVITRAVSSLVHSVGSALGFGKEVEVGKGEPKADQMPKATDTPSTALSSREIGNPSYREINTLQVNRQKAERFVDKEFSSLEPKQRSVLKRELLKAVDTDSLHREKVLDSKDFHRLLHADPYLKGLSVGALKDNLLKPSSSPLEVALEKDFFARSPEEKNIVERALKEKMLVFGSHDDELKAEAALEKNPFMRSPEERSLLEGALREAIDAEPKREPLFMDDIDSLEPLAGFDPLKEDAVDVERLSVRDLNVSGAKQFFQKKEAEIQESLADRKYGITRDRLDLVRRAFEYEVMRHTEINREPLSDSMLEKIFEQTAITMLVRMRFNRPDKSSIELRDGSTQRLSAQEKGIEFVREKTEEKLAQSKEVWSQERPGGDGMKSFEVILRCSNGAHEEYKASDVYKEVEKVAYYRGEIESLLSDMQVEDPKLKGSRTYQFLKREALEKDADWAEQRPGEIYTKEDIANKLNGEMYMSYLRYEKDLLTDVFPDREARDAFEKEFKDNMKANLEAFKAEHPGKLYPLDGIKVVFEMALAEHLDVAHEKHDRFVARFPHLGAFVKKHEDDLGYKYASEGSYKGVVNEKSVSYFVDIYLSPAYKLGTRQVGEHEAMLPKAVDAIVAADALMEKTGFIEGGQEASMLRRLNAQIKDLEMKRVEILRTSFGNPHANEVKDVVVREIEDKLVALSEQTRILESTMNQIDAEINECVERGDAFFQKFYTGDLSFGLDLNIRDNKFALGSDHITRIGLSFLDAVEKQATEEGVDKVTDEWMEATLERIAIEETVNAYRGLPMESKEGGISQELNDVIKKNIKISKSVYSEKGLAAPILQIAISTVNNIWINEDLI